jgi:putative flavoprotein involved in K+ transport
VTPAHDVLVVGGGQAALAVGFYLRRCGLSYALLDAAAAPGGAWRHGWPSLRLFSPARWSSLPGWLMPGGEADYPSRDDVVAYLAEYERRYALAVERPVDVQAVRASPDALELETSAGPRRARAVVSATGSWAAPVIPELPGQRAFRGDLRHSSAYDGPARYRDRRVVVVGAGNSGAQIVADLAAVAREVTWATLAPPRFLPDEVDGRYLFEQATVRWKAQQEGRPVPPPRSLGDVVMVPPVRAARDAGRLAHRAMFVAFTDDGVRWPDGDVTPVDAVVWATGFRPALAHLAPLGVVDARGRVALQGTRSVVEPRLWLVGYGDWTGFASATLVGVGRSARATVDEIVTALARD